MDALTRRQFDRAMFAKNRTLAIRVEDYASQDIKEASFEYGYIKGDTYKPGGTCAGSGKITFTSIITTFNKLDILHPEIGLLVGDTYQWVKMGEYFINDIEIDRNRNTTTLELMDGMFKLNREYVTDLHFPAEVREVIQEICLKTGIELANDYFGISAMRYHVEQVPEGKKLSFRDMLSAMTQMIGMSCFFNREGKMEIRDLTESNITINADSYFLHGLTKSEIEYQIAGITCKTDKKPLTVGMKTGRSLELDNVFMTQSALNDLYYKLKNLTYYPYNLNYQGHLLLEVGQWVTIQTNKKETFKVPVLSQSFTFKGGLRGRISADSKAGNDTQYSYEGTITKQIKQQDGIEAKIQAQIEAADAAFDAEFKKRKKEIDDGIELAKAKAEEVKQELSDTINQRFNSFDNGPLKEAKRKAEEALKNAGASSLIAQEAKQIGLDSIARLEAFKSQTTTTQTALSGDLDALKRTIANDIRPKQAQAEDEIAKQVEALNKTKNELAGVKSAQATYEETTTRRLSELTNLANGKASKSELVQTAEELASRIASVQVGGRNYIRNGQFKNGSKNWLEYQSVDFGLNFNYQHSLANRNRPGAHFFHDSQNIANFFGLQQTFAFDGVRGEKVSVSLLVSKDGGVNSNLKIGLHYIKNKNIIGQEWQSIPSTQITSKYKRFTFTFTLSDDVENLNLMLYGEKGKTINLYVTDVQLERGSVATDYKEAPEDTDGQISAVESTFKQRADSLEAGVRSLNEGLRTKADISSLNVTAENIRQSVKSLETDTQNKLNQKLSLAEFEVRAGSIRQEILNATKDKADKTLVTAEAGKLREELASLSIGGRNLALGTSKEWSTPFTNFSGNPNTCPPLYKVLTDGLQVGDTLRSKIILKYTDVRSAAGKTATVWLQGNGNVTGWTAGAYTGSPAKNLNGSGEITFEYSFKITENHLKNAYWNWMFRTDFIASGSLQWRLAKVESGSVFTNWSPAPEDTDGLITEAKATFERTAQGLRTDLSSIQEYVGQDSQRQEALQRYTREESARQATAVREQISRDYVGKSAYQEDVRGLERRFSAISTQTSNDIASKIAQYKQTVDGQFSSITSQIAGKANQTDFQRVRETSQLYERIIGSNENDISNKVARMALTNQLFQVEVSKNEGLKTVQRQLAGSWAVQNINSAGDIISGINLGANGHNRITGKLTHITGETLIDNAVIKSAMVDKLKTANFEAGSVTTTILDAEAVTADKVRFDDAFIRKMIANEAFINQLTSKRIFATKVESVITSSTVLEGYKGWIGGFQLGTHDSGYGRWITGRNHFSVGMGNGEGGDGRTALWVNWGNNWSEPGYYAWFVKNNGKMYCYNTAEFWKTPIINGDLKVTGRIRYDGGVWIYSSEYEKIGRSSKDYFYLEKTSGARDWFPAWNDTSDRRLKSNIQESSVSGIDVINRLKTYSYRKEFNNEVEDISCGIMAQDVQKYAPDAFREGPDGVYTYNTFALVPYLIKAIQELNQKIEKMEKTIA